MANYANQQNNWNDESNVDQTDNSYFQMPLQQNFGEEL